ncbi:PspC domain-containing protein [Micromonospora sp. NPDC049900]|uniref:PspC domain-containing protein n=1 Tax=Micromonospora sp. NPDC049900 TaxID=3364275 RepID=UPI0037A443EF
MHIRRRRPRTRRPAARSAPPPSGGRPRGLFWCRINEGKWFGGVCLGVAAYGEFRVDWLRTVALLLTLFTGGLLAVAYLSPRRASTRDLPRPCRRPSRHHA